MIDLVDVLQALERKKSDWTRGEAEQSLNELSARVGLVVDWDVEAGEDWARLLRGERVLGLLSITVPLLIASTDFPNVAENYLSLTVVTVSSLDDRILKCGLPVLESVFGERVNNESLDPECFSASDLWFVTV